MKVLITGSQGLLGREVIRILEKNYDITCLVRDLSKNKKVNVSYLCMDLSSHFSVDELPNEVDVILHMAQSPHYHNFPEQAEHVFKVNCAATARLLDYAVKAKVKHFLFTSTGSVYEPYVEQLREENYLDPSSFYANSKLIAERLLVSYKDYFNISVLRLFFLYGPHADFKPTLINGLMQRLLEKQEITIEGKEGGLRFTPTLTTDVAQCIKLIIEKEITGTLNIASPEILYLQDVVTMLSSKLGVEPNIKRIVEKPALSIMPDTKQIENLLPEMKFTSFEEGITQIISRDQSL